MIVCGSHPIRLLCRTESEITPLFHSFFIAQIIKNNKRYNTSNGEDHVCINCPNDVSTQAVLYCTQCEEAYCADCRQSHLKSNRGKGHEFIPFSSFKSVRIEVLKQFPAKRKHINDISAGIELCLLQNASKFKDEPSFGVSVVTTGDGDRYYAYWKGFKSRIFIGYSSTFFSSFARNVFDLIALQPPSTLDRTLMTLCEIPIHPSSGIRYDIRMTGGTAQLSYAAVEQANCEDMAILVLNFLSPKILVSAWVALLLEKNVIVVGSDSSIVFNCCEFMKKTVLPLCFCNIYIPQLFPELIEVIQGSPVPYLIGADTKLIHSLNLETSNAVIIDLDNRTVSPDDDPDNISQNNVKAPPAIISKLILDISTVVNGKLCTWINRTSPKLKTASSPYKNPEFYNKLADEILNIFIKANLALLGSRACTVKAFYRKPTVNVPGIEEPVELDTSIIRKRSNQNSHSSMGFEQKFGAAYGFMQLLREKGDFDDLQHFNTVWVEIDTFSFQVYENADDIPFISLETRDIDSVSPSPIEPEGHVFEVVTRSTKKTYRFTTTDQVSRRYWLTFIEESMNGALGLGSSGSSNSSNISNSTPTGGGSKEKDKDFASKSGEKPSVAQSGFLSQPINASNFQTPVGYSGGPTPNSQDPITRYSKNEDQSGNSSSEVHLFDLILTEQEDYMLSAFRNLVMKTQAVSYMSSKLENDNFDSLLREKKTNMWAFSAFCLDDSMKTLLPSNYGITINKLLDRITNSASSEQFIESSILIVQKRQNEAQRLRSLVRDPSFSMPSKLVLTVNSKVEFLNSQGKWVTGQISKINKNNTFDIAYPHPEYSEKEVNVANDKIKYDKSTTGTIKPGSVASMESKRRGGGILDFIFGGKAAKELPPTPEQVEERKREEERLETERMENEQILSYKNYAKKIAISHHLCDSELTNSILDSRLLTYSKLNYFSNIADGVRVKSETISFNVNEIFECGTCSNVESGSSSTKSNSDSSSSSSAGGVSSNMTAASVTLYSPSSWFDQIWLSLGLDIQDLNEAKWDLEWENNGITDDNVEEVDLVTYTPSLKVQKEDAAVTGPLSVNTSLEANEESQPSGVGRSSSRIKTGGGSAIETDGSVGVTTLVPDATISNSQNGDKSGGGGSSSSDKEPAAIANIASSTVDFMPIAQPVSNEGPVADTYGGVEIAISGVVRGAESGESDEYRSIRANIIKLISKEIDLETIAQGGDLKDAATEERDSVSDSIGSSNSSNYNNNSHSINTNDGNICSKSNSEAMSKFGRGCLLPIMNGLMGYLQFQNGNLEEALTSFSLGGNLVDPRLVMEAILERFTSLVGNETLIRGGPKSKDAHKSILTSKKVTILEVVSFLAWANKISSIVGLQAYRLVTEVLHRNVIDALIKWTKAFNQGRINEIDIDLSQIESRRVLKATTYSNLRMKQTSKTAGAYSDNVQDESLRRGNAAADAQDFVWAENPHSKYDCLNEIVVCTSLHNADKAGFAWELSVQLLSRLREVIKNYCRTKGVITSELTINEIPLSPGFFDDLVSNSSYRAFALQCAKLQMVQLKGMTLNERMLFFFNIYNMLTLHGLIVRGIPGSSFLPRINFMNNCRYNISDMHFSLMEIEHGILRYTSSPVKIAGFNYQKLFDKSDPRSEFVIEDSPKSADSAENENPLIFLSGCLFTGIVGSPPLQILTSPESLYREMKRMFQQFISRNVVAVDSKSSKVVRLPKVLDTYYKDFSLVDHRRAIRQIEFLMKDSGYEDMKLLLHRIYENQFKYEFVPYNWSSQLVLNFK